MIKITNKSNTDVLETDNFFNKRSSYYGVTDLIC